MGITIHFEGKLKTESSYEAVVTARKRYCIEHCWSHEIITESHVNLNRYRDENDWDYQGPTKGIEVQPHENSEPFRLEFDKNLYVQEYTKTQFAPIEIHVQLVNLLRLLQPYFENLEVVDEGEFFETNDNDLLASYRNRCFELLEEYLVQDEKYYGPIRLDNNRIVDVMSRD